MVKKIQNEVLTIATAFLYLIDFDDHEIQHMSRDARSARLTLLDNAKWAYTLESGMLTESAWTDSHSKLHGQAPPHNP